MDTAASHAAKKIAELVEENNRLQRENEDLKDINSRQKQLLDRLTPKLERSENV